MKLSNVRTVGFTMIGRETGLSFRTVPRRMFSDQASTKKRLSSSLKKMMKPFFLKCHPDVQSSTVMKKVNLEALQTLNGFMDTLDATCDGKVVDWPKVLPIEFLLSSEAPIAARKKKADEQITRRRLELVIPSISLRDAIVSSKGSERLNSIRRLQHAVQHELAKILQMAGLPLPKEINTDEWGTHNWEHILQDDDQDNHHPNYFGQRFTVDERPKTKYQQSREEFYKTFDREMFNKLYKEPLADLAADQITTGHIAKHAKLRQNMINGIIAKIRIDIDSDIGAMDQLITLRRLSLIFEDNFDNLHMEEFGRMWEELTIVLTNQRDFGTSQTALHKRRKRGEESGFQFTYAADKRVTVHIPIDFRDEELLKELDRNLWDWFDMVDETAANFLYRKYR